MPAVERRVMIGRCGRRSRHGDINDEIGINGTGNSRWNRRGRRWSAGIPRSPSQQALLSAAVAASTSHIVLRYVVLYYAIARKLRWC
jgi:hypothetical protein